MNPSEENSGRVDTEAVPEDGPPDRADMPAGSCRLGSDRSFLGPLISLYATKRSIPSLWN